MLAGDIELVEQVHELVQPALALGLLAQALVERDGVVAPPDLVALAVHASEPLVPGRAGLVAALHGPPVRAIVVRLSPHGLHDLRVDLVDELLKPVVDKDIREHRAEHPEGRHAGALQVVQGLDTRRRRGSTDLYLLRPRTVGRADREADHEAVAVLREVLHPLGLPDDRGLREHANPERRLLHQAIENPARVPLRDQERAEPVGQHRVDERLALAPALLLVLELRVEAREDVRRVEHQRRLVLRVYALAELLLGEVGEGLAVDAEVGPLVRRTVQAAELAEAAGVELVVGEQLLREAGRRLNRFGERIDDDELRFHVELLLKTRDASVVSATPEAAPLLFVPLFNSAGGRRGDRHIPIERRAAARRFEQRTRGAPGEIARPGWGERQRFR